MHHLPPGSKGFGFDVSLAQFPSLGTVPQNVTFDLLNINSPIPDKYHEKFDIVHVRLLVAAVQQNDPIPILKNLIGMLKPGGILQWGEITPVVTPLISNTSDHLPIAATNIYGAMTQHLNGGPLTYPISQHWILNLASHFSTLELQNVETVLAGTPRKDRWKFWSDNCTGAMEELVFGARIGPEFLQQLVEEREKGVYWWFEPRIVIGWKLKRDD
jgi:hypothetical protein